MNYTQPPEAVELAKVDLGQAYVEWHEKQALSDLRSLCDHEEYLILDTWYDDESRVHILHATIRDTTDGGKPVDIEIKWSTDQIWRAQQPGGCWMPIRDTRNGPHRKVRRG